MNEIKGGKIYFIGAGPGDPELITVKGQRILQAAHTVVYAGSLINPAILGWASPRCEIYDSASLNLEEIIDILARAARRGDIVARLHTGDPSLYGAIAEQIHILNELGIPWVVIPGVSSFTAAAAVTGLEYTLPGVSQTLIITRRGGRTPVPARENLSALAMHQASLCLFLSSHMLQAAAEELMASYPPTTPARIVYRASWPDQKVIDGTLHDIAAKAMSAGIHKTALLLVGEVLRQKGNLSRLYSPEFKHGYRGDRE